MDRLLSLISGGFTEPFLVGLSADEAYYLSLATATNISPTAGLSAVEENDITGGVLHGLAFFTNGVDAPHYWPGYGQFGIMTNWNTDLVCKTLRPFKNFLIAGNITEQGNEYPTKLIWSASADPGALPSWDETNPMYDAGSITLSDTPGAIVDGTQSLDSFFVYKEDAVYELQYIGGVYIFKASPRFYNFGVMTRNCVLPYRGKVFAFGQDDLVVHTSTEMKSIATKTIRKRLFNGLGPTYRTKVFVIYDAFYKEVLFCVPWNSDSVDYAFTYNPETGRWGERELPQCTCGVTGKALLGGDTWDADSDTWDSDTTIWGEAIAAASYTFLGGGSLYGLNETWQHNGINASVVMERKSIDFGAESNPNERIKFVSVVRPNIVADIGVSVLVQLGVQMKLGDPVDWSPAQTFTVGTTRDLHFRLNGRYISWRVSSTNDDYWKLESIDVDVKQGALW